MSHVTCGFVEGIYGSDSGKNLLMTLQTQWKKKIYWTKMRINCAWWLRFFLPFSLLLSALFVGLVFWMKRVVAEEEYLLSIWIGYWICLFFGALICFFCSRRHFFSTEHVVHFIDAKLKLDNRLGSALRGLGKFPEVPDPIRLGLSWRKSFLLMFLILDGFLIFSAKLVPVKPYFEKSIYKIQKPGAWKTVENWVEVLENNDALDSLSLRDFQKQVKEFQKSPQSSWYNHSNLEAGDSLRGQLESEIRELSKNLDQIKHSLHQSEELKKILQKEQELPSTEISGESLSRRLQGLQNQLNEALERMSFTRLSLDPELMKALKNLDLSNIEQIEIEKLTELMGSLQKGLHSCEKCLGGNKDNYSEDPEKLVIGNGFDPGNGGIARGPGSVPLNLIENNRGFNSKRIETIKNQDGSQIRIGDTLGTSKGEHEIDSDRYRGLVNSGTILSSGKGGEVVWKHSIRPHEQELLKRYFR